MWFYTEKIILSFDLSPAEWVTNGLRSEKWDPPANYPSIASWVPDVFESYARILHPVNRSKAGRDGPPYLTWKSVAEKNGKTVHSLVQFECIDGVKRAPGEVHPWTDNPREGSLEPEHLHALMDELAKFTVSEETCWFGLWEGWGGLTPGSAAYMGPNAAKRTADEAPVQEKLYEQYRAAPRVKTRSRDYILFSGDLSGADAFVETRDNQSMSIWWSDSRSWFVATEIDLRSTYVGGSKECIAAILNSPLLEAYPANADDRFDRMSDTINC